MHGSMNTKFYFKLFFGDSIVRRGTEGKLWGTEEKLWGTEGKLWLCLRSNYCFMRAGRQSVYFATNVYGFAIFCTCWQRGQFHYIADIMESLWNDVCTVFLLQRGLRAEQLDGKLHIQHTNTHTQLLVSSRNGYPMENPVSYLLCGKLLQKIARLIKLLVTFIMIMRLHINMFRVSVFFPPLDVLCDIYCARIVPWWCYRN